MVIVHQATTPVLIHCGQVGTLDPLRDFLQTVTMDADFRRAFWYALINVPQPAPLSDLHALVPFVPADYSPGEINPVLQAVMDKTPRFVGEMLALDEAGAVECLDAVDEAGEGAWHYVAKAGRLDLLSLLDRVYPYADKQTFEDGLTPLHLACTQGNQAMAEALLARGADPRIETYASETLWSLLVDYGQTALSPVIREYLPYAGTPNDGGEPPLRSALYWGNAAALAVIQDLTAVGADPWKERVPDRDGTCTIWDWLIDNSHGARAEILAHFVGLPGGAQLTLADVCASGEPEVLYAWLRRQGQAETLQVLQSLALLVHAPAESWAGIVEGLLAEQQRNLSDSPAAP